jgi:transposase
VFHYPAEKSSDAVVSKLARFRGTLTADAEHRFNAVYAAGNIVESGCNAHGRRTYRDAEATQPTLALEGGRLLGAMYGEEETARKLDLRGEDLRRHRQDRIRPIPDEFDAWRGALESSLLPSEPLAAAVRYYRNHRDALYRSIDDPDVPIDNSPTEREFQNVAKLRLNVLIVGSTEGAHRAATRLGIVA